MRTNWRRQLFFICLIIFIYYTLKYSEARDNQIIRSTIQTTFFLSCHMKGTNANNFFHYYYYIVLLSFCQKSNNCVSVSISLTYTLYIVEPKFTELSLRIMSILRVRENNTQQGIYDWSILRNKRDQETLF